MSTLMATSWFEQWRDLWYEPSIPITIIVMRRIEPVPSGSMAANTVWSHSIPSRFDPTPATTPPMTERRDGRSPSIQKVRGMMTSGVVATIGNTMPDGVVARAHW